MFNFFNYTSLSRLTYFLPPELLHQFFLQALRFNIFQKKKSFENLETKVLGKHYNNPIGLAAGFDKNAEVINGSFNLNFGFVEVGTVTPMPQKGNPKPRVFKIPEFEAIIQRLGFNNAGIEVFLNNLKKFRKNEKEILGVNIGKNKRSKNPISDYKFLYNVVQPYTDYVTINISSPNTPGLRSLHSKENFLPLFEAIKNVRELERFHNPIFIKLSPDEEQDTIFEITAAIKNFNFDGAIASNTTVEKSNLIVSTTAEYSGGLSGKPLLKKSNALLNLVHLHEPELLKIGVGGVHNKESFDMKLEKGASLVQIYTSFIYHGPKIIKKLLN